MPIQFSWLDGCYWRGQRLSKRIKKDLKKVRIAIAFLKVSLYFVVETMTKLYEEKCSLLTILTHSFVREKEQKKQ